MKIKTLLKLGRVSNLPTVWTNILAAVVLAQFSLLATTGEVNVASQNLWPVIWTAAEQSSVKWLGTFIALSMMYVGGMFLNDAFDAKWDKQNNPSRPIAAGEIVEKTVWIAGLALLIVAIVIIGFQYQYYFPSSLTASDSTVGLDRFENYYGWIAALLLALTILVYNAWHKRFSHSAFIMGACRLGVYAIGALLLVQLTSHVVLAALSLLLYIAGLTYLARQEHLNKVSSWWPLCLLFSPVLVAVWLGQSSIYFWLYLVGFSCWMVRCLKYLLATKERNVKTCILGLLAAIPLVDGLMLASVSAYATSIICLVVFVALPKLQKLISAT